MGWWGVWIVAALAGPPAEASVDAASAALIAELQAMPDDATRRALLDAKLGAAPDAATAARVGAAIGALAALEEQAVDDAAARQRALEAALGGVGGVPATDAPAAAPTGQATICFGRPGRKGKVYPFSLFVNDAMAGQVVAGGYISATVPSGPVALRLDAENDWSTTLEVSDGEAVYLEVVQVVGLVYPRVRVERLDAPSPGFAAACAQTRDVYGR